MNKKSAISQAVAAAVFIAALGFAFIWLGRMREARESEVSVTSQVPVKLYYFNQTADQGACSADAVLPVQRHLAVDSYNPEGALDLWLKGELTPDERARGFITELPNKDFKLLSADLHDGRLVLNFSEVPGFTDGGSCRMSLLWSQIQKTAAQFPEVREVKFTPETLFQP